MIRLFKRSRPEVSTPFAPDDAEDEGETIEAPDPSPLKAVVFENVTRRLGHGKRSTLALDNINVSFEKGRFVGILGAPRSGKTALLNVLNGNEEPDEGHVIHGMSVSWPMSSREVFNKMLSVRSNIRFVSEMYGAWPPGMLDAVVELTRLRRADIEKPLRELPDEVHNRAVTGLCFALKFDCYIADEILCRGSRQFRDFMFSQFEMLRGRHSLVIATKNVQTIRDLCDDCFLLEAGRLKSFDRKGDAIRAFKSGSAPVVDSDEDVNDADES